MSRVYGRSNDVYQITRILEESEFPEYKRDNRKTTWEDIKSTKDKIKIYLPDKALDFLSSKKIKIMKKPLLRYTETQVPDNDFQERIIKFPSVTPIREFNNELAFYYGMLLSSYKSDSPNEQMGIPGEYEDTLPLLLEYLYLKENDEEDLFTLKYLNEAKTNSKYYPYFFEDFQEFENLRREAVFANLSKIKKKSYQELYKYKENQLQDITKERISQLSSLEGTLGIIEKAKTKDEIKKIIEELMLNESDNRSSTLYDKGIESYGYKRLRREINRHSIN